jgi:hypothetical protein
MRKIFLIFLLFPFAVHATNYYVSTTGSDSNNGLTTSTPFLSITKVNTLTLSAGDSVLFKRGNSFYGALNVNYSGTSSARIVYGAYGTGALPVITGFTTLTGWSLVTTGIYQSYCAACKITDNMVTINGIEQQVGRYPNHGYLTYTTFVPDSSINSPSLIGAPNWVGGEVVIKKTYWIIDRNPIIAQSDSTLVYTPGSSYPGQFNYGFFIQRDSLTLDTMGEWYLNTAHRMKMFFGTNNPSSYTVKTSTIDTLINISKNYITILNIDLEGANIAAIATSGSYITVNGCTINLSGQNGITLNSTAYLSVTGCNINHTNNNAITQTYPSTNPHFYVGNTSIKNTALIPGMGLSDDGQYNAITNVGDKSIYEYNTVDSTGYIGINFGGDSTIVRNNLVSHFCLNKQDGGGIYTFTSGTGADSVTWTHRRKVYNNIVLNGIGNIQGTYNYLIYADTLRALPNKLLASGIYMDNNTSQVDITNNTSAYNSQDGVLINSGHDIIMRGNNIYNNVNGWLLAASIDEPVYSIKFLGNIVSKDSVLKVLANLTYTINVKNTLLSYTFPGFPTKFYNPGKVDSNYYYAPVADTASFMLDARSGFLTAHLLKLPAWQALNIGDAHSIQFLSPQRFDYNATQSPITIPLAGNYIDAFGITHNGSIILQPFTSSILSYNGVIAGRGFLKTYGRYILN